jgi:ABC-type antimicrobial peptide transport system permease subunit
LVFWARSESRFSPASLSAFRLYLSPLTDVFSISIGVFFSLYTSYRASMLDPIRSIGYAE